MNEKNNDFKIAHLMNLDEIFEKRFFIVPDYQRGYAWEKTQRVDLFNDIEHLMHESYTHFTGTIVASQMKNKENTYAIVDGQQRLTTLIIILHECMHREEKIKNNLTNIYSSYGPIGNKIQKFTTNTETKLYFDTVIINNDNKTLNTTINSHRNISNAKKEVNDWLNKQNNIEKLVEVICKKLGFIFYTPDNTKEIGIMFEVINNRGKPLSQLEKIKNFLIYYSTKTDLINLHEAVNNKWGIILQNLSRAKKWNSEDETNFLRYCWLVYFDKGKQKSYDVYAELKLKFPLNENSYKNKEKNYLQLSGFLDFLQLSSKNYAYYFSSNEAETHEIKNQQIILKSLRSQNVYASIMPLVISIMATETKSVVLTSLLELIEKLNFRVYILPNIVNRADSGQGELFSFAHSYFHLYNEYHNKKYEEKEDEEICIYENITYWLIHKLKDFTNRYCPAEDMDWSLIGQENHVDYYKWRGLRYFLISYEEYINDKKTIDIDRVLLSREEQKTDDYYSIEHFWAQKNRIEDGQNNREKDDNLKKRLGNLGLLEMGINIQASHKSLEEKLHIYFGKYKSDLKQISEVKDIFKPLLKEYENTTHSKDIYYFSIYESFIKLQEEKYIKFAQNRWKI